MSYSFLKAFVKNPQQVGAIAPSSPFLTKEILRYLPTRPNSVIVEYGPGTGVFTRQIMENKGESRFFAIERNATFVNKLASLGVDVHCESAEMVGIALKQRELEGADMIVSGLPWSIFSTQLQNQILDETVKHLRQGGVFSTFAYVHSLWFPNARSFHNALKKRFDRVLVSRVVWKNLPPALIYHSFKD